MKSSMQHEFSMVSSGPQQRSKMRRIFSHKTAIDASYLIPFFVDQALPGDTIQMKHNLFARLVTLRVPVMDNIHMEVHSFAVPERIMWTHFKAFMGEQDNPMSPTDYLMPRISAPEGGFLENSIFDYMGVPPGVPGLVVRASFFRAYNKIFNRWFRRQWITAKVPEETGDTDVHTNYSLKKRSKRPDFAVSCNPFPQAGPAVPLPLAGEAPVFGNGNSLGLRSIANGNVNVNAGLTVFSQGGGGNSPLMFSPDAFGDPLSTYQYSQWGSSDLVGHNVGVPTKDQLNGNYENTGLIADMSEVTASTVSQLRTAFQMQKYLERIARGGNRYPELMYSLFGVLNPDSRMQDPEYLGGSYGRINIYPVQQTSGTPVTGTPQGNLAAFGNVSCESGFVKTFTEHCIIMSIVSIRADQTYQHGLPRMFSQFDLYDFYTPPFAHVSEVPVFNKEIFAQGSSNPNKDNDALGYQEAWYWYRYGYNMISGKMRSTATQPLDAWHLAEQFTDTPGLNESFISDQTDITLNRSVAVLSSVENWQPQFYLDCLSEGIYTRNMPMYSEPGLIDHM